MNVIINTKKSGSSTDGLLIKNNDQIEKIRRFLPPETYQKILPLSELVNRSGERIEEIRLRCGMRAFATVGLGVKKRNVELPFSLGDDEMSAIVKKMCDGSMYAYTESMIRGYISLGNGIRVGICGKASVENGKILGIYNISALNIRFPLFCLNEVNVDARLLEKIRQTLKRGSGVLVYSPPAQGKTTFLRKVAFMLSSGKDAFRVVIVDSREELASDFLRREASLDIMSGYPQAEGIRIATAFMNPQVIICDEIGREEDALAIAEAQNCGVPLFASAHGDNACGILKRGGMARLHEAGAFGLYIGISIDGKNGFRYSVRTGEEIDNAALGNDSNSSRQHGRCVLSCM